MNTNKFSVKSIKFYNGNKHFKCELLDNLTNTKTTHSTQNHECLLNILQMLETSCVVLHDAIDITLITNSFYSNSLKLLMLFKNYPKLFTNTKTIKICVTTFLIMGWNSAYDNTIPQTIKEAFKKFKHEATNEGYTLIDYCGEKLVCDKKIYLFSQFVEC